MIKIILKKLKLENIINEVIGEYKDLKWEIIEVKI